MISIVVPAVWGYEPFCNFLHHVVELPVIGEIIIINNNIHRTPDHPVLLHPKVKHLKMENNIYVNPAWNMGVSLAQYDHVCIMNDDIAVDLRVFAEADKFISKDIGLLSIGIPLDVFHYQIKQYDKGSPERVLLSGDIKIKKASEVPDTCGAGSFYFIHKANWIPIPDKLKIYWGDTWQLDMQMHYQRMNYYINNCFYYSPWFTAGTIGVGSEYQQTVEFKEYENFEYFNQLKKEYQENETN